MRCRITLFVFTLAALASACSTRPGSLVIFYNGATTIVAAGLSIALTTLSFMRCLPIASRVCLALLLLHPAWTMIAFCCDCGEMQMSAAVLDGTVSLGYFVWDSHRRRVR